MLNSKIFQLKLVYVDSASQRKPNGVCIFVDECNYFLYIYIILTFIYSNRLYVFFSSCNRISLFLFKIPMTSSSEFEMLLSPTVWLHILKRTSWVTLRATWG